MTDPDAVQGWSPVSTHLPIGAVGNLRDLGGTPTLDGRVVAHGRLYRAEALVQPGASPVSSIWDEVHGPAYRRLGVATVLDLRSEQEQDAAPSAWPIATGAELVSVPIEESGEGDTDYVRLLREGLRTSFTVEDMARYYAAALRLRGREIGCALRVLARRDNAPVLVHCAAGKDRTGMVIALVLEVLGVGRADVVADYALTGVLRPNRVEVYSHLFVGSGVDSAGIAVLFDTPGPAMGDALAGLEAEFGSVANYLLQTCGLGQAELDALRVNLLSP